MSVDDSASVSSSSLATPKPIDDDASPGEAAPSRETFSERMYVSQNNSLKALALLSLGLLNDDGSATFNPANLPWSAALRPTTLKMTAKELRQEVLRRNVAVGNILTAPRPKQWTVAKATEWLVNNPIVGAEEVAFIRATITQRVTVAEHAQLVQQEPPPCSVDRQ